MTRRPPNEEPLSSSDLHDIVYALRRCAELGQKAIGDAGFEMVSVAQHPASAPLAQPLKGLIEVLEAQVKRFEALAERVEGANRGVLVVEDEEGSEP